jgi:hypothetical protein
MTLSSADISRLRHFGAQKGNLRSTYETSILQFRRALQLLTMSYVVHVAAWLLCLTNYVV